MARNRGSDTISVQVAHSFRILPNFGPRGGQEQPHFSTPRRRITLFEISWFVIIAQFRVINGSCTKIEADPFFRADSQPACCAVYSLIVTAKMNDVDPQVWLSDVLARIAAHPAHRIDELLPWNWKQAVSTVTDVAA